MWGNLTSLCYCIWWHITICHVLHCFWKIKIVRLLPQSFHCRYHSLQKHFALFDRLHRYTCITVIFYFRSKSIFHCPTMCIICSIFLSLIGQISVVTTSLPCSSSTVPSLMCEIVTQPLHWQPSEHVLPCLLHPHAFVWHPLCIYSPLITHETCFCFPIPIKHVIHLPAIEI